MNSMRGWMCAMALAGLAAICPQESSAGGFSGADFARWELTSQDSYIETSVTMAGIVLTQTHPDVARCVNEWYFKDNASRSRNPQIRAMIAQHSSAHPSGVILAVLLRECGPLS